MNAHVLLFLAATSLPAPTPAPVAMPGLSFVPPGGWQVNAQGRKAHQHWGGSVSLSPRQNRHLRTQADLISLFAEPALPAHVLSREGQNFFLRSDGWYFRTADYHEHKAPTFSGRAVSGPYFCGQQPSTVPGTQSGVRRCVALLLGQGWAVEVSFPESSIAALKQLVPSISVIPSPTP